MGSKSMLALAAVLYSAALLAANPIPDSCTTIQENGMTITRCSDGKGGVSETRQGGFSNSYSYSGGSSNSFGNPGSFPSFQLPQMQMPQMPQNNFGGFNGFGGFGGFPNFFG